MFTVEEWERLKSLANLPDPPPDPSNKYVGDEAAAALGQKFYFDPYFSGLASHVDMLGRPIEQGRAPKGKPILISCNTCHDVGRAGADFSSVPGHVSVGAGLYDVNGQQTYNSAYWTLLYWNGRSDSLWSQAAMVTESSVSMNGNRLKIAWRIADAYRDEYNAVFKDTPLPLSGTRKQQYDRLAGDGQCRFEAGKCPTDKGCVLETNDGIPGCWPRFPLQGKQGHREGCQRNDPYEPFRDAFDCMSEADQDAINRVFVNYGKAIAAYEYKLISRNAPFDQFVNAGPASALISESAKRGAKLFVGKAGCIDCHSTPLFADNGFHNIGVPQVGGGVPTQENCTANTPCDCVSGVNCLPWGAKDGIDKLKSIPTWQRTSGPGASWLSEDIGAGSEGTVGRVPHLFRRDGKYSDAPDVYRRDAPGEAKDEERIAYYELTPGPAFEGAWRTPSLRDVALTAPYMHNGMYKSLEEVLWHYNNGGATGGASSGPKDVRLQPLHLTDGEIRDLVDFLHTLNGEPLPKHLTTSPFIPEEEPL